MPANTGKKRILVGAASFADAVTAIRLAARLAQDINGLLGGMMVEEEHMLSTSQLPNQRVISGSGSVLVAPSVNQIRTLIDADAKAFRQMLADHAGTHDASWTFEQQVGELVRNMSKVAEAWDILVFGHRDVHSVKGQVVLLETTAQDKGDAARVARILCRQLGCDLKVLSIGSLNIAPSSFDRDHERPFDTAEAALSQLARINTQAVVVDLSRGPIRTHRQLRALLDVARCPVIVLGASLGVPRMAHDMYAPPPPDTARPAK
jgi:hypothetical protein